MRRFAVLFLVIGTMLAITSAALAGGRTFTTTLAGVAEAPDPGDPDGSGEISLTINPGTRQVCYDLHVEGVAPILAGHIHEAAVGVAGGVVVDLMLTPESFDADGDASACVTAERSVLIGIMQDPAGYYVNVHNVEYPGGALRGQLG